MSAFDRIELLRSVDDIPVAEWRALAAASPGDTVFASWEWLKSWRETLGSDQPDLLIPLVYQDDRLLGAVALENRGGVIGFAARERRDYCEVLVRKEMSHGDIRILVGAMLDSAKDAVKGFRRFEFSRVPESSPLNRVAEDLSGFHAARRGSVAAPRMDMAVVDEKLRKKSLRRHANALARMGTVSCATHSRKEAIDPLLEPFFDQHVRRWAATDSPSLFVDPANRSFYRALAARLGDAGSLRFSTVHLDDRLVAAHFGFLHAGTFIWYKPSFEPELARHSPGEVLIKYLLEVAKEEGANVFDFTIGEEEFKLRFATEIQQVHDLWLTDSLVSALVGRGRSALGRLIRE